MNKKETLIATLRGSIEANRKLAAECTGYNLNSDSDYDLADGIKWLTEWMEAMFITEKRLTLCIAPPNMDEDFNIIGDKIQAVKKVIDGKTLSVEEILKQCEWRDNVLYLPKVQLSKKSYDKVKLWITEAGGKWTGGNTQGFTFDFDANRVVDTLLQGKRCNLAQEFQFFETPDEVADWLVSLVGDISPKMKILEPSAGRGAIIKAIRRTHPDTIVDCYELMPENREILAKLPNVRLLGEDFTKAEAGSFDVIIANPPFSGNQDIRHIGKMFESLVQGGTLAAITSKHWTFADEKECRDFRDWVKNMNGRVFEIEEGAFNRSGTGVGTMALVITKQ
mgnify:CR=1 FL=1